jgi:hypothetical protein
VVGIESLLGDYVPVRRDARGRANSSPMWIVVTVQVISVLAILLLGRRKAPDQKPPSDDAAPKFKLRVSYIVKGLTVVGIIVAIGLPWALELGKRSPEFLQTMIFKEVGERASTAQEGHQGPFGYYLLSVWPTFLPWSLLLPAALVLGWQRREDLKIRFAVAAVLGPWLMLEEVRTKLPHYLLPAFIPLAFLVADVIVRCLRDDLPVFRDRAFRGGVIVWTIVIATLGIVPAFFAIWLTPQPWPAIVVLALVAIGYAGVVSFLMLRGKHQEALGAMGIGALLLYAVLFRIYLPSCEFLRLSQQAADVLIKNGVTGRDQVIMLDYKEPSLAFYQGGTIREQPEKFFFVTHPFEQWPKWMVIREDIWARLPAEVTSRLDIVGTCRGLDLADQARFWTVHVVRKRGA